MNLNIKLWFLNILLAIVVLSGIILAAIGVFDNDISTELSVILPMITIPLTALSSEMAIFSNAVAKNHYKKEGK